MDDHTESKVSSISYPPQLLYPPYAKHKLVSIASEGGRLTGSLFLNVMMVPSIIGDMVTQSIKRSQSST